MKRMILLIGILFSATCFSQTNDQRENKLLESLGTLASAYIYNTYITIGSMHDGLAGKIYSDSLTISVLEEQQSMLDVVIKSFNTLLKEKALKDVNDVNYVNSLLPLLSGLKGQAQADIDYLNTKNAGKSAEYSRLRMSNWKAICVMLNIPYKED